MTTPREWDGADHNEAPYLPDSQPVDTGPARPTTPTDADAPFVPAPVAAPPTEPAPFDAKAMVEAQKNYQAAPAYGSLPSGNETNREAAQQLRAQARQKRRRNVLFGRAVAVVLVGGLAAAGWFGYQAYQDQQDRDAAERAAIEADDTDGSTGADAAIAALTPLGEQQQIVEAMGDLNSTARSGAGGLLGAVQDARDIVDQPDGDGVTASPADPFAARTVDFVYRRWENASATSPMVEYGYSYDRVADTYLADIVSAGTRTSIGTTADHRAAIYPDGVVERVPRSETSLDPAVDIALAVVFDHDDVVPVTARPFATLVESRPGTDSGDVYGYTIDTDAWRDRDPGSFLAWVTTWHPRTTDDPSLVDLTRREVSTDEHDTSDLRGVAEPSPLFAVGERTLPGAAVTFVVAPEGYVIAAVIVDNTADIRIEYLLGALGDQPAGMDLGDHNWTPAP